MMLQARRQVEQAAQHHPRPCTKPMFTVIATLCALLFIWLMVAGAWHDLFVYRIPNICSLLSIPLFFTFAIASKMPFDMVTSHAITGAVVFVITFAMFLAGAFGGGDAKMMSAIALWLGFDALMPFLMGALLIGGFFGIFLMVVRRLKYPPAWLVAMPLLHGIYAGAVYDDETIPNALPYGVPMAAMLLILAPHSNALAPFFTASTTTASGVAALNQFLLAGQT
jgi:prepilin peptidase CpaA